MRAGLRRLGRLALAVIATLLSVVVVVVVAVPVAAQAATSVPWTDPNAVGYIGFCNAANQQIRSGSIVVHPFVIKAVASVPAPKGYQAPNGRGTVFVYQPIDGIDPGDWSGKQMTGASGFTDSNHPMASGLVVDPALVDFSSVFPLRWQGLLQVRMFYTAPDAALFNTPYPVANLRISGTTWTQVGGGPVNCAGGQARSNELALPQKKVAPGYVTAPPSAQPAADQGSAPGSGSGRITGAASTRSATASAASAQTAPRSSSGGAGPGDSSPVSADSTASSKPSSALPIVVLIIVVGLAVAATGGFVLYRRRGRAAS